MSELNLIKTVLFNAASLNEALTRLDELGISYRESQTTDMYCIDAYNVQFWVARSLRCPLAVFVDNQFFDYEDRKVFLAHQPETVETQVPAASPDLAGEQPVIPEQSTESVDILLAGNVFRDEAKVTRIYPKLSDVRHIIRTERRLKLYQAKGLSS